MKRLCARLNEWWRGDQSVRFECEHTRILLRVNETLTGILFMRDRHPHLQLIVSPLTDGIAYYVDRVVSASWLGMELQRVVKS